MFLACGAVLAARVAEAVERGADSRIEDRGLRIRSEPESSSIRSRTRSNRVVVGDRGGARGRGGGQQLGDVSRVTQSADVARTHQATSHKMPPRVTRQRERRAESRRRGIACGRNATNGVGFGSRLHPGQRLELAAGLVEITFDDGAAVVLEGPATFDVRSPRRGPAARRSAGGGRARAGPRFSSRHVARSTSSIWAPSSA